jgi:nucleotide-binding universal stress UspA family protein
MVMSVAEFWLPPPPPSSFEILEEAREVEVPADLKRVYSRSSKPAQEALEQADKARQRLQINFPRWDVRAASACGTPAWELISKADEWKPDLIVVGSHGRSGLARLMLGSVSQRILAEARCSVRVARGRVDEPGLPVRILIGIDGSAASKSAVSEVASRVWSRGTEVRLLVAEDPLTPTFIGKLIPPLAEVVDESNREDRRWIEEELAQCMELLPTDRLQVSKEIRVGEPKRVLIEVAEEWGADSIFLGAIGFSNRLERFVLGSVSAAVAARAHCSVEAVRRLK